MTQVPIKRTPIDPATAEHLLRAAYEQHAGKPAPDGQLRLLLALWDLETDAGRSMFHYNFGNIVLYPGPPHFYVADDSGNTRRFAAYGTPESGASDFVRLLLRKAVWRQGLESGHPREFAVQLKRGGYYEAPLSRYVPALIRRWRNYGHLQSEHGVADADSEDSPSAPKPTE